ncbi:MAG: HEAT repeat domain-containing protein [Euryarchaeota archaeon]|nr:HEAT repeat domain-containing protein [Euryarchaeota archaeon]
MGEYDFDRLTRFKKVDVLQKALNDDNEHQRFKAVEALEAIALASGTHDLAYNILVDAASHSTFEDVKLHAKIALKTLDGSPKPPLKADNHKANSQQHQEARRNISAQPLHEEHGEDRFICELNPGCTALVIRGSTISPQHRVGASPSGRGRWDNVEKAWILPIDRSSFEHLKRNGVKLHPTVHCLSTSQQDTWAVRTKDKKFIKILGDTANIEASIRKIPASKWDSDEHVWKIPFSADAVKRLIRIDGLYVSPFILD